MRFQATETILQMDDRKFERQLVQIRVCYYDDSYAMFAVKR